MSIDNENVQMFFRVGSGIAFAFAIFFVLRGLLLRRTRRRLEGVVRDLQVAIANPVFGLANTSIGLVDSVLRMSESLRKVVDEHVGLAACWERTMPLLCAGQYAKAAEAISSDRFTESFRKYFIRALFRQASSAGSADAEAIRGKYPFVLEDFPSLKAPEATEGEGPKTGSEAASPKN
jgi:hypothetical protein